MTRIHSEAVVNHLLLLVEGPTCEVYKLVLVSTYSVLETLFYFFLYFFVWMYFVMF